MKTIVFLYCVEQNEFYWTEKLFYLHVGLYFKGQVPKWAHKMLIGQLSSPWVRFRGPHEHFRPRDKKSTHRRRLIYQHRSIEIITIFHATLFLSIWFFDLALFECKHLNWTSFHLHGDADPVRSIENFFVLHQMQPARWHRFLHLESNNSSACCDCSWGADWRLGRLLLPEDQEKHSSSECPEATAGRRRVMGRKRQREE